MAKRTTKKKQPDHQQLARKMLDSIAPEAVVKPEVVKKNPAAVALGRLGGLIGGKARAEKLSAKRRSEIARHAAASRWRRKGGTSDGQ
jgi:hypothetical protein